MKAPYAFPLRSRAAIAAFLTREGRSYHYNRYRFVWNVKTHGAAFDGTTLRRVDPDLDPALDAAWQEHCEDNDQMFWAWCEDAARHVSDGDWASYPGTDQGDWDLAFAGRSGGWLVLQKWQGRNMVDIDPADFLDPEIWPFDDLKAFYRGIVCADQDFTPAKAAREVEYFAACDRAMWEEEIRNLRREEADAAAREMEQARPDLAPVYA
jgi:hypothetical protein